MVTIGLVHEVQLKCVAVGIVLALLNPVAAAQPVPYPSKPIRIVVASSPGGGLDIVARGVGQQLTVAWGQSVVIDNRSGAPVSPAAPTGGR